MVIDNIKGFPGPQVQSRNDGTPMQVSRNEPTKAQDETGRPSSVDTVSLTDAANRLQGLVDDVSRLPVVDSQRVEDVRRALDNGSFEVDYDRVAEKFLKFEDDLG